MDIYTKMRDLSKTGEPFALVTVIGTKKSTPQAVGAKMVVDKSGAIAGTVGGGALEALAIEEALTCIKAGISKKAEFSLDPGNPDNIAMLCGGDIELFIDVSSRENLLVILGGGHIGLELGKLAEITAMPYIIADDREEYANRTRFPGARDIMAGKFRDTFDNLPVNEKTFIVIVTRCHEFDLLCLELALKTRAGYIGMIGSRDKVKTAVKMFREDKGIDLTKEKRLYAPVGLAIGGKNPGEIAVSIIGQILTIIHGQNIPNLNIAST